MDTFETQLIPRGQVMKLRMLPVGRARWRGAEFAEELNRMLAFYVRAQLVACLIIGLESFLLLVLLRVPYALVLGAAAGLLEFIPLLGPLLAVGAAVLLASTQSAALGLLAFGLLAAMRVTHDYAVYPRLIARGTRLPPAAIILSILCGAELGGVPGLFLSIPMTVVLSISWRHMTRGMGPQGWWRALFVDEEPADRPAVRVKSGRHRD